MIKQVIDKEFVKKEFDNEVKNPIDFMNCLTDQIYGDLDKKLTLIRGNFF